jgi:putative transposase
MAVPFNPNEHHRRSIRLEEYDHSQQGAYFVTVCTRHRQCTFGEVIRDDVLLSDLGRIAQSTWEKLPEYYDHVELDAFVAMPNHVHGIIVLEGEPPNTEANDKRAGRGPAPTRRHALPEIVRAFKSLSSRAVNKLRRRTGVPLWQRNYYERVIRNEKEWDALRGYIFDNPANWAADAENPRRASDTTGWHDASL